MAKGPRIAVGAALVVAAVAVALALALITDGASAGNHKTHRTGTASRTALTLSVGAPLNVHPIRPGFLGLSIEYPSIEPYAGTDPGAINPTLINLIRNITPNQSPVIRIGGDSSDWEWWPVPGMARPGGVKYTLTPTWVAVTSALARQLDAKLILGLDLEANSLRLASTEAAHFVDGIGKNSIEAFEPGNEPELYGSWPWYVTDGRRVHGRPASWSIGDYARQVMSLRRALETTAHTVPIAGPATGGPTWLAELPQFIRAAPYLSLLTIHHYPVQSCYTPTSSPKYPSIANLLSARASRGLAASAAPSIALAHARGIEARVDEINTNSCGSAPAVTKSFASALWATDALFAMAAAGADGVNVHTYKKSSYELFQFDQTAGGQWRANAEPEYYGLYLFALAAPAGSRLLALHGPATKQLSAWATRGPDGHLRVTLINDDLKHGRTVAINAYARGSATPATLITMNAPSASARAGTNIGGQTFDAKGQLAGRPQTQTIAPRNGRYVLRVPPASAVLLVR